MRGILILCLLAQFLIGRAQAGEAAAPTLPMPPGVKAIQAPGIQNLFTLGPNIFSGSAPEGDDGFAALARLGIKTIISVDGTTPDVDLAHKYKMRYVHLPHGYDGISSETQAQLVRAKEMAHGPVFIHCHHGKHRGPAAAAVVCMAEYGWTHEQAEAWLRAAGTATNYVGLYKTVRDFKKPTGAQLHALPGHFPEVVVVSGLTETMVEIDGRFDNLKAIRAAGYIAPNEHPDLAPANEAVILYEHFREAQRLPEAGKHGTNFLARLQAAEAEAHMAESLLHKFAQEPKPETRAQLDKTFDAMAKTCAACHQKYRDPAGIKSRP